MPVEILFDGNPQIFNIGAASCGVPGTAAGLWRVLERFGSAPMPELAAGPARLAREGVTVNRQQSYLHELLTPILTEYDECRALYAPDGDILREGDVFSFPALGDALERYAKEGPEAIYAGDVATAICGRVRDGGGTLTEEDLAAYEPVDREPVHAFFRGRDILSNPPPSAGGVLIAFALAVLERAGSAGIEQIVAAMEEAQALRTEEFHRGLYEVGFAAELLRAERIVAAADRVGSTTHISALDAGGSCASVTCSNGTGSGIVIPGTGVHVNNMLGEEDLNPLGFHALETGLRLPSMMAPSVVLREGEVEMVLGSGGSNRIRSAILQAIVRLIVDEEWAQDAVSAPRVHFEAGVVQAEPGVDEAALGRLESRGYSVNRWERENWFFGGVHAVARDPETGAVGGGGDPRRGGAVALA